MNSEFKKNKIISKHLNVLSNNDNILNQNIKPDFNFKPSSLKAPAFNKSLGNGDVNNNPIFENFVSKNIHRTDRVNNSKTIYPNSNYYFKQYKEQYEKHSLENGFATNHSIEPSLFGNYKYQLPPDFNPRQTSNMPFNEKVTNWLDSVPIFLVTDKNFEDDTYTPDNSINWEEEEIEDYLMGYDNEENLGNNPLSTADEIIQFQAKRFDCLSKKLYLRDD